MREVNAKKKFNRILKYKYVKRQKFYEKKNHLSDPIFGLRALGRGHLRSYTYTPEGGPFHRSCRTSNKELYDT